MFYKYKKKCSMQLWIINYKLLDKSKKKVNKTKTQVF